ncbi:MAG: hypothetical protein Sv326_0695 [Candidatus Fermentimicrarchaeum limneticum]|uniref:Uncharacterized protein n=1 Tax=Fermentimicrarchaeum limneticum TaxID=2795018 RepID=A0A7D5XJR2_FERL1|nr:MAG: hypothetical protein Sv326_0695 [Candidatus Fermentimicrarchaeum limneticum]
MVLRKLTNKERYELVLNSAKYFRLFVSLYHKPEYPENLCEKFKVSVATMGERLKNLCDVGLIKKDKKDGRKQYYDLDEMGFLKVFWKEQLDFMIKKFFDVSRETQVSENPELLKRFKTFESLRPEIAPILLELILMALSFPSVRESRLSLREFLTKLIYSQFKLLDYNWEHPNLWKGNKELEETLNKTLPIKDPVQKYVALFDSEPLDEPAKRFLESMSKKTMKKK